MIDLSESSIKQIVLYTITILSTYATTYIAQIADKKAEITKNKSIISEQGARLGRAQTLLDLSLTEIKQLENVVTEANGRIADLEVKYDSLQILYDKATSSNGVTNVLSSLEFDNYYTISIKTGDIIEISLLSNPILIRIKRITDRGIIINVEGCKYFLTENGVKSPNDGKYAFLVKPEIPMKIQYNYKSSKDGIAFMAEDDIEVFSIRLLTYDFIEQTAIIEYGKKLWIIRE
ncbi:hypothetical protein ACFL5L_01935 [candidate division KSB1 bacterium]